MKNNLPKHTRSAGGVVVNNNGQVLVVSQHGKTWSLPKGHIEKGKKELNADFERCGAADYSCRYRPDIVMD